MADWIGVDVSYVTVRPDGLISRDQAAELCGVTADAITKWVRLRKLRVAKREGRRVLYNIVDVARAEQSVRGRHGPRRSYPSWELEGEPDADMVTVLRSCDERARQIPLPAQPLVYYIRFGDRVKIGTTVSLTGRLGDLPHDEVLGVEPGGRDIESKRHQQFAADQIRGEWFALSDAIRDHVSGLPRHQ